ncbi:MAG: 6,7-dimethyl-8-ribityllumazine synthase [Ignavibacteriales bacterium]|nr:6,7-dimethyl-8-ribityllumazine synthase [Ignavibacteriales bacterium]
MNTGRAKARSARKPLTGYRFAIVVSRFNSAVTKKLLDGAVRCLKQHRVSKKSVKVVYCPGAFELPQVANKLAFSNEWDAILCLGAVIRGETPHFEYVSSEAARGIQNVALWHALPVLFGVLTTDTMEQALERAGGSHGNKGWDAALAAIEMLDVFNRLKRRERRAGVTAARSS